MEYSIRINKFNTNKLNSITIKKCSYTSHVNCGISYMKSMNSYVKNYM